MILLNDDDHTYQYVIHMLQTLFGHPPETGFIMAKEVDTKGRITDTRWVSLSGNAKWDAAVKNAAAQTKALSKGPPKGFPSKFIVRFDVESIKSESLQLSSN